MVFGYLGLFLYFMKRWLVSRFVVWCRFFIICIMLSMMFYMFFLLMVEIRVVWRMVKIFLWLNCSVLIFMILVGIFFMFLSVFVLLCLCFLWRCVGVCWSNFIRWLFYFSFFYCFLRVIYIMYFMRCYFYFLVGFWSFLGFMG